MQKADRSLKWNGIVEYKILQSVAGLVYVSNSEPAFCSDALSLKQRPLQRRHRSPKFYRWHHQYVLVAVLYYLWWQL